MRREVLPYAQDAWYVEKSIRIGYEINFNRYFYRPEPRRTLEEIGAEITAVEREAEGLLAGLLDIETSGMSFDGDSEFGSGTRT